MLDIDFIIPYLQETPEEYNSFSYAKNNPIRLSDPKGLFAPIGGPGFTNLRREGSPYCPNPYEQCLDQAANARKLCTKLLWAAEAKCVALCAIACTSTTAGYGVCFVACAGGCHTGFAMGRRGCWLAYMGAVEGCRRTYGK